MKVLLATILASSISCIAAFGWGFGCAANPVFPFLRDASYSTRVAFFDIITDQSLTRDALDGKLEEWAEKYSLKDDYEKYRNETERLKMQAQEDARNALVKLADFFEKVNDIENDRNITIAEGRKRVREMYETLNWRTSNAASCIATSFASPSYAFEYGFGGCGGFGRGFGGFGGRFGGFGPGGRWGRRAGGPWGQRGGGPGF
ncbi:unnamed protein product [Cylicocyclus nassatus]|uniref:SXP/RAL-2 family protein Ani s 5-like cation-binding domain-containing protein n=1 Tax=Cylicocyclus nassatus TaxID=53992 RepID=A0AA36MF15_CYLNA|nr:unnamed protein product [Cylicocyclus nassatus]